MRLMYTSQLRKRQQGLRTSLNYPTPEARVIGHCTHWSAVQGAEGKTNDAGRSRCVSQDSQSSARAMRGTDSAPQGPRRASCIVDHWRQGLRKIDQGFARESRGKEVKRYRFKG